MHKYIDEILEYLRDQFVCGKVSSAKNLIYDCVVVTQNRHCITILDRATYCEFCVHVRGGGEREKEGERRREGGGESLRFLSCSSKSLLYERNQVSNMIKLMSLLILFPFPINREVFRQLFGSPSDKKTYMKVIF